MKLSARVHNSKNQHHVTLRTNENVHAITIFPKPTGFGSSANGGELLFLALATCYCNDIYREATKRGIIWELIEVEVEGDFGAEGAPVMKLTYRAKFSAHASAEEIRVLMNHTDRVAENQNILRIEAPATLNGIEVLTV